jgi:diaminopimelate epimerase
MKFSRWHALGNVYLLAEQVELTPDLVREAVGDADGILQVVAAGEDEAHVVIWNADGSTAELSGNGTRIAARWLAQRSGAQTVTIRVGGRAVRARMLDGVDVEQEMGEVVVRGREEIDGIAFVAVDVGNPHAVVVGEPGDIVWIGPKLESHPRFPNRTNVQVARIDGPGHVTARVWERGVGETSSSGTGAVAVAAACAGTGRVTVHFPGGDLRVCLDGTRAFLTGPAEEL